MSGIAGELRFDQQPASISAVERIARHFAPRGPNGGGFFGQDAFAFGHRRLDVMTPDDASAQPMQDPYLGLSVVFDGAIYNYQALRHELESLGYRFFSLGDAEVLLKGFHAWGEALLPRLDGPFAFAIHRSDSGELFLARDRLGIKPLYFSLTGKRLRFASSLPALLRGGDLAAKLNPRALNHYLSFHGVVPGPETLIDGIEKLAAGSWLRLDAQGRTVQRRWWNPAHNPLPEERYFAAADWQELLLHGLRDALARQHYTAAPTGLLLCGGLASSLLLELLRETHGGEDLATFSIAVEPGQQSPSETPVAEQIARHYRTRHQHLHLGEKELLEALPATFRALSEPMASPHAVALYQLCGAAAGQTKALLCPPGAVALFSARASHFELVDAADPVALYLEASRDRDYPQYTTLVQEPWLAGDCSADYIAQYFANAGTSDPVEQALRLDSGPVLAEGSLRRLDDLSMVWGLEARLPFLDHRLAELAARMPARFKREGSDEHVLTQAARRLLPAQLADRAQGLSPLAGITELGGETLDWLREILTDPSQDRGIYQSAAIERLLADPACQRGCAKLWQLATLNLWLSEQGL